MRPADLDHFQGQAPAAAAVMERADVQPGAAPAAGARIAELRALALTGLSRMYDSGAGRFVFRLRKSPEGILREGLSDRYTAITAIGLAHEAPDAVRQILGGDSLSALMERLIARRGRHRQPRRPGTHRLGRTCGRLLHRPRSGAESSSSIRSADRIRPSKWRGRFPPQPWIRRLRPPPSQSAWPSGCNRPTRPTPDSSPITSAITPRGQRGHVTCFADLVYPTLALAQFGIARRDHDSIRCAAQSADRMCRNQGPAGQWWWHFDYRTGRVLEGYPVYAVHQTSMAPMALLAAADAADTNYDEAIARGLDWLSSSPELEGRSLIDRGEGLIWRKVARREPAKLSRYVQAAVSRVSPNLRAPAFFPADGDRLRGPAVSPRLDSVRVAARQAPSSPGRHRMTQHDTRVCSACRSRRSPWTRRSASSKRPSSTRRPLQIGVVNAAKLVNMRRDTELRADVLSSDLVLADGMAVVWASRLLGRAAARTGGRDRPDDGHAGPRERRRIPGLLPRGHAGGAGRRVWDASSANTRALPSPARITATSRKRKRAPWPPISKQRALISCSSP